MSEAAKSSGQLAGEVEVLLNRQVRPLLKIHGGGIDLSAVSEGGRVELEFQGARRGCPALPGRAGSNRSVLRGIFLLGGSSGA